MEQIALQLEADFVVDWQITEDQPVIDLSTAETEVILSEAATVPAQMGLGAQR